jgi:hypothetical protein
LRNNGVLFNRVEADFRSETPLTPAEISHLSPRHDDERQGRRENRKALGDLRAQLDDRII